MKKVLSLSIQWVWVFYFTFKTHQSEPWDSNNKLLQRESLWKALQLACSMIVQNKSVLFSETHSTNQACSQEWENEFKVEVSTQMSKLCPLDRDNIYNNLILNLSLIVFYQSLCRHLPPKQRNSLRQWRHYLSGGSANIISNILCWLVSGNYESRISWGYCQYCYTSMRRWLFYLLHAGEQSTVI